MSHVKCHISEDKKNENHAHDRRKLKEEIGKKVYRKKVLAYILKKW